MKTLGPIFAVLAAGPVAAQETFSLPAGCEAYATVQKRGCIVTHLFTCESDPDGHQRRADIRENGLSYVGRIDFETQWIESFYLDSGATNQLGPTVTDPASFTELLDGGADSFDFETTSDLYGTTRIVGSDYLTGNDITINGITLLGTAFDVTAYAPDGTEDYRVSGQEFIVPEWRVFTSGIRTISSESGDTERNTSPVDIILPGQDGFLSVKPRYDCSVVLSNLEALQ